MTLARGPRARRSTACGCGCSTTRPRSSSWGRTTGSRSSPSRTPPATSASWRWSSGATAPSCAPPRSPAGPRTPLLGVNLGHVGFLAEAESEDIDTMIEAVVERRYTSEERMTLDVSVYRDRELVETTWALNEASVEKAARQRMLEVDHRGRRPAAEQVRLRRRRVRHPDRFHGVQLQRRRTGRVAGGRGTADRADQRARAVRTPDGGGARLGAGGRGPGPDRGRTGCSGATGGGRSSCRRVPASRCGEARTPVRLVRLHEAPFTDRLVAKFGLPVEGWRGGFERRRRQDPTEA